VVSLFGTGDTLYDGVLLTGQIQEFLIDAACKFEFRFSITGGLLASSFRICGPAPGFGTNLCDFGTVVDLNPGTPFAGTFAADFDGRAMGPGGAVTPMGLSGSLDQCTAQIGGFVQNTATLGGIDAVAMTMTGGVLSEAGTV